MSLISPRQDAVVVPDSEGAGPTWLVMDLRVRGRRLHRRSTRRTAGSASAPTCACRARPTSPASPARPPIAPGGELYVGGHTYQVESGVVEFRNPTSLRPDIRFNARTSVSGLRHHARHPDPQRRHRDDAAIGSAVARGRHRVAVAVGQRRGGGDAAEAVTEQLAAALSGEIVGAVGRAIGFDSVRVEQSNPGDVLFDATLISSDANPGAAPDVFQARLPRSRGDRQPEPPRERRRHLDPRAGSRSPGWSCASCSSTTRTSRTRCGTTSPLAAASNARARRGSGAKRVRDVDRHHDRRDLRGRRARRC